MSNAVSLVRIQTHLSRPKQQVNRELLLELPSLIDARAHSRDLNRSIALVFPWACYKGNHTVRICRNFW